MKNMQYNSRICLIPRLNLKLKKEKKYNILDYR